MYKYENSSTSAPSDLSESTRCCTSCPEHFKKDSRSASSKLPFQHHLTHISNAAPNSLEKKTTSKSLLSLKDSCLISLFLFFIMSELSVFPLKGWEIQKKKSNHLCCQTFQGHSTSIFLLLWFVSFLQQSKSFNHKLSLLSPLRPKP